MPLWWWWYGPPAGNEQTAAVAPVAVAASLPPPTATYASEQTVAVASVVVAVAVVTQTATYASIQAAAVAPAAIAVTAIGATATYASVRTATVAPVTIAATLPAVTATSGEIATVAPVAVGATIVAPTATYASVQAATVAPVAVSATAVSPTATYISAQTAAITPVAVSVTAVSPTATYASIQTAAVATLAVGVRLRTPVGTKDTVAGGTYNYGFGAAISSTSRFCVAHMDGDALPIQLNQASQSPSHVIKCWTAYNTVDGLLDFSAMNADGFSLVVDDQFSKNYRISYLALGGSDLENVYIGSKQMPGSDQEYDITGVGFEPDAVLLASVFLNSADNTGGYAKWGLGWATGSSAQGAVTNYLNYNVSTSNSLGGNTNTICLWRAYGSKNSLVSFGADGFRLSMTNYEGQRYFYFVCLKGSGQYSVGDLTTRTDGNDITETVGFQPGALLFASANKANSASPSSHSRGSFGAATSIDNRACAAISDESGLPDTETAYANYDSAVYANIVDDATVGLMDLKSIDATGFTCVMDDPDPSAAMVSYLALESTSNLFAKVGSFNIDKTKSVGQTQTIAGVGFEPKIVLFFWGGSTAEFLPYASVQMATVTPLVVAAAPVAPTATYISAWTAAVAPVSVSATVVGATAKYAKVATVAPVAVAVTPVAPTATYVNAQTATVAPLAIAATIITPTATYVSAYTAAVAPVAVAVIPVAPTATYASELTAAVASVAIAVTLPPVWASWKAEYTTTVMPLAVAIFISAVLARLHTPDCRMYTVPADDRTYTVPADDRAYEVPCG